MGDTTFAAVFAAGFAAPQLGSAIAAAIAAAVASADPISEFAGEAIHQLKIRFAENPHLKGNDLRWMDGSYTIASDLYNGKRQWKHVSKDVFIYYNIDRAWCFGETLDRAPFVISQKTDGFFTSLSENPDLWCYKVGVSIEVDRAVDSGTLAGVGYSEDSESKDEVAEEKAHEAKVNKEAKVLIASSFGNIDAFTKKLLGSDLTVDVEWIKNLGEAMKNLQDAKTKFNDEKDRVDNFLQHIIEHESELEHRINAMKALQSAEIARKKTLEGDIPRLEQHERDCADDLQRAEDRYQEAKKKREDAKMALWFVPFGWVVNVSGGTDALGELVDSRDEKQRNVSRVSGRLDRARSKLVGQEAKISVMTSQLNAVANEKATKARHSKALQQLSDVVGQGAEHVKKCVGKVSELLNSLTAVDKMKKFGSLDLLLTPLQEMAKRLEISGPMAITSGEKERIDKRLLKLTEIVQQHIADGSAAW